QCAGEGQGREGPAGGSHREVLRTGHGVGSGRWQAANRVPAARGRLDATPGGRRPGCWAGFRQRWWYCSRSRNSLTPGPSPTRGEGRKAGGSLLPRVAVDADVLRRPADGDDVDPAVAV